MFFEIIFDLLYNFNHNSALVTSDADLISTLLPIFFIIFLLLIFVLVGIFIVMYIISYVKFSIPVRKFHGQLEKEGFIELPDLYTIFNDKEIARLEKKLIDVGILKGNRFVSYQHLRSQILELVFQEGVVPINDVEKKLGLRQDSVIKIISDISDVTQSSDDILYSHKFLKTWMAQLLEDTLKVDVGMIASQKNISPEVLLSIANSSKSLVLSQNRKQIFAAPQLITLFFEGLKNSGSVLINSICEKYQISVEELKNLVKHENGLMIKDDRHLVASYTIIDEIHRIVTDQGIFSYSAFTNDMALTGLTKQAIKEIIQKTELKGVFTDDWGFFLTYEYAKTQFQEISRFYSDLDFVLISEKLGIPVKQISHLLSELIQAKIITGMIDRTNQRFFIREIPVSLSDQLVAGHIASVSQIEQDFGKSLNESCKTLQGLLPSNQYVLTRESDVIRIIKVNSSCQVCGTSSISEFFLKCETCSRDLCWNHFEELSTIGRVICPHCDGSLHLFPKFCEICNIDYIRLPIENDHCDYCGYLLKPKEHIVEYQNKYLSTQKSSPKTNGKEITENNGKKADF